MPCIICGDRDNGTCFCSSYEEREQRWFYERDRNPPCDLCGEEAYGEFEGLAICGSCHEIITSNQAEVSGSIPRGSQTFSNHMDSARRDNPVIQLLLAANSPHSLQAKPSRRGGN